MNPRRTRVPCAKAFPKAFPIMDVHAGNRPRARDREFRNSGLIGSPIPIPIPPWQIMAVLHISSLIDCFDQLIRLLGRPRTPEPLLLAFPRLTARISASRPPRWSRHAPRIGMPALNPGTLHYNHETCTTCLPPDDVMPSPEARTPQHPRSRSGVPSAQGPSCPRAFPTRLRPGGPWVPKRTWP